MQKYELGDLLEIRRSNGDKELAKVLAVEQSGITAEPLVLCAINGIPLYDGVVYGDQIDPSHALMGCGKIRIYPGKLGIKVKKIKSIYLDPDSQYRHVVSRSDFRRISNIEKRLPRRR